VATCTDSTCRAGGTAVHRVYHVVLDVYNRATHALICSTAARGSLRCPAPIRKFGRAGFAPGRTVELSLSDVAPYGLVYATVTAQFYAYPLGQSSAGKPADFTRARIVAEFGTSPWAHPALKAPTARLTVMSFDRPAPPPAMAEIADIAGGAGGIASGYWRHHRVSTNPGRAYAAASSLWDHGYGFTVYLR
jgi:hypothetical protein